MCYDTTVFGNPNSWHHYLCHPLLNTVVRFTVLWHHWVHHPCPGHHRDNYLCGVTSLCEGHTMMSLYLHLIVRQQRQIFIIPVLWLFLLSLCWEMIMCIIQVLWDNCKNYSSAARHLTCNYVVHRLQSAHSGTDAWGNPAVPLPHNKTPIL